MDHDELFLFVEDEEFTADWARNGLNLDDLYALQNMLVLNPEAGPVISGAGGVRKVRFAPTGKGKSGAFRVFYTVFHAHGICYLVTLLAKSEKANPTKADRNALAELIAKTRQLLDQGSQ